MSLDVVHRLSQPKPRYAVTIAVSSRTLFNMVHERKIYEEEGMEKYVAYQVEHENEPLKPGAAFPFVKVKPLGLGCGPSNMDRSGHTADRKHHAETATVGCNTATQFVVQACPQPHILVKVV